MVDAHANLALAVIEVHIRKWLAKVYRGKWTGSMMGDSVYLLYDDLKVLLVLSPRYAMTKHLDLYQSDENDGSGTCFIQEHHFEYGDPAFPKNLKAKVVEMVRWKQSNPQPPLTNPCGELSETSYSGI